VAQRVVGVALRRIGQVSFSLAGDPIPVKKGNNLPSEVGEALSYDDYVVLLATPRLSTDTTTTSTTTTGP